METEVKKLYRSRKNRVIFGVLGGFGEFFKIDPSILRAAYIIVSVFSAFLPGLIAYVLMAIVIPEESENTGTAS